CPRARKAQVTIPLTPFRESPSACVPTGHARFVVHGARRRREISKKASTERASGARHVISAKQCEKRPRPIFAVMASLYEKIGGEAAVMAAVALFYEKVLADDVTKPFFEGLDMDKQTKKQIAFMTVAF